MGLALLEAVLTYVSTLWTPLDDPRTSVDALNSIELACVFAACQQQDVECGRLY